MQPAKMLEEAQSQMRGTRISSFHRSRGPVYLSVPRETLMNELDAGLKRAGLVSQVLHGGTQRVAGLFFVTSTGSIGFRNVAAWCTSKAVAIRLFRLLHPAPPSPVEEARCFKI